MKIIDTSINDLKIIEPFEFEDERGFFLETYRDDWFNENISKASFVQENHSRSIKGTLRGLHYQIKKPQGKLVRVVSGTIYDVAVDLRCNSPTFGKCFGLTLSCKNKRQLWVPEGFAHGFYVISESADFVYKCTNYYSPENERAILWNDKDLSINWPIESRSPLVSFKDASASTFREAQYYKDHE